MPVKIWNATTPNNSAPTTATALIQAGMTFGAPMRVR